VRTTHFPVASWATFCSFVGYVICVWFVLCPSSLLHAQEASPLGCSRNRSRSRSGSSNLAAKHDGHGLEDVLVLKGHVASGPSLNLRLYKGKAEIHQKVSPKLLFWLEEISGVCMLHDHQSVHGSNIQNCIEHYHWPSPCASFGPVSRGGFLYVAACAHPGKPYSVLYVLRHIPNIINRFGQKPGQIVSLGAAPGHRRILIHMH
jgi:hypothetical protein